MAKYALFSVTDKRGIIDLGRKVAETHTILASGGTGATLKDAGIEVTDVSEYTSSPEMFGGRVKTLHPRIHGGILFKDTTTDREEADKHNIGEIDLVVCNLYQFGKVISHNTDLEMAIEHIDIGGPTLIRAAAKNYQRVTVVVDPADYPDVIPMYPDIDESTRVKLAAKAFRLVTAYDSLISNYISSKSGETGFPTFFSLGGTQQSVLRYGENPHQRAVYYSTYDVPFYTHIYGPDPSYNNLLDLTAGWNLAKEFEKPTSVIIKHRSPCGVASGDSLREAYQDALETDKMSAYGGVYIFNKEVDKETAEELVNMFVDVLLAPAFVPDALEILKKKQKMKILRMSLEADFKYDINLVPGGFVLQDRDLNHLSADQYEVVSERVPTAEIISELLFAWTVVKHSRSNSIVVSSGMKALGIGSGQTSRVDATESAIKRAGLGVKGAVLASDAFFPFADSIEKAAEVGIKAVISPKGSIRDQEVIKAANKHGIYLVFTSVRSFKH